MECPLPLACFQFWLKGHRNTCAVSQKMTKRGEGKREEKVGGTERRFLLLSLHTFNLLLPSALANSVYYRALSPPCSALPGCSPFGIESCLPLQSGGLRSHSLIVEEIFVPCLNLCTYACLLAQLSCCLQNCGTSPQSRWTKCMDRKQGPDAPWESDGIYGST